MKAIATDERMVYLVTSETRPGAVPYRVDLTAHGGRSECACKHWRTTIWPILRDDDSARPTCKHVRAARDFFLNGVLETMARQETEPCPTP